MARENRIVDHLVKKAYESDMASMHAACIVSGGKILHEGNNSHREFINGHRVSSIHAEIAALHEYLKKTARKDGPRRLRG